MAKEILICPKCKAYTLKKIHCDLKTLSLRPAKFSLEKESRIGVYRRRYKHDLENNKTG